MDSTYNNKKLTLSEMQQIAKERGGECLSEEYVNVITPLEWKCSEGHKWKSTPHNIKRGRWCPVCGRYKKRKYKTKYSIVDMREIAEERGGKCLSKEFLNSNTHLVWECKRGHRWNARPTQVISGSWCPFCVYEDRKRTIEEMQQIAKERGGKCLSTEYINIDTKLLWECSKGHKWEAIPYNIVSGRNWCPVCRKKYIATDNPSGYTIKDMQNIATQKGGKCLSKKYLGSHYKLTWRCKVGHEWESRPTTILSGGWCPICSIEKRANSSRKYSIKDFKIIAEERHGECLSTEFTNSDLKLRWRCNKGHEWEASGRAIINGQWCPMCRTYRREEICRNIIEYYFEKQFPKKRPKWLINSKGNIMELDGYNEELGVAFEHQGLQHYEETEFFNREKDLATQKKLDREKREKCLEKEVFLLEIPYLIPVEELEKYILNLCDENSLARKIKREMTRDEILNVYSPKETEELREIAKMRGGKLLSKVYVTATIPLVWRCSKGHEWKANPHMVRRGTWCPICGNDVRRGNIEECIQLARKMGGECLSTEYLNSYKKMKWKCKEGHIWFASFGQLKNENTWCSICSNKKRRLGLERMKELARERGGECLSTEYFGIGEKLKWRCKYGHEWNVAPKHIVADDSWCPVCAREGRKKTIEEMQQIAKDRGGKCLSKKYVGVNAHLLWKCKQGHKWKATPSNVLRGTWCPACALTQRKRG